ncbi:MAG: MobC family plasmid mobilization relaxosome protein [Roseburia sp.]
MEKSIPKHFRITEEQQRHLDEQSQKFGVTNSEYLRRLIDADRGEKIEVCTQEDFLQRKKLIYEINKIGNNINQIVRNVNMHYYTDYEKKKLFAMMKKIMELLEKRGEHHDTDGTDD